MREDRLSPFRDAQTDRSTASEVPDTPQTRSPAYRLAFADDDFLCRDELRPVRLQLELLKPEMIMTEREITSTIVMFGGCAHSRAVAETHGTDRDAGQPVGIL